MTRAAMAEVLANNGHRVNVWVDYSGAARRLVKGVRRMWVGRLVVGIIVSVGLEAVTTAEAQESGYPKNLPPLVFDQVSERWVKYQGERWESEEKVEGTVFIIPGGEIARGVKVNDIELPEEGRPFDYLLPIGEIAWVASSARSEASRQQRRSVERRKGLTLTKFDFMVSDDRSKWRLRDSTTGTEHRTTHRCRVWIEERTGAAWRVEMMAADLPSWVGLEEVELRLENGFFQGILVPFRFETQHCTRENVLCERRVVQFRNYRASQGALPEQPQP